MFHGILDADIAVKYVKRLFYFLFLGGREVTLACNYTSPQSLIITFSYSLGKQLWGLHEFLFVCSFCRVYKRFYHLL